MTPHGLAGARVLVVKDDALLGLAMRHALDALGCAVVGPAAYLGQAPRLAADTPGLSWAILDLDLRGRDVWPVTEILQCGGIPYLITTGYGDVSDGRGAPVLEKPFKPGLLAGALGRLLDRTKQAAFRVTSNAALH